MVGKINKGMISVIVPVYNEQDTIVQVLGRIWENPILEHDFEVIVVNDGSQDRTLELLKEHPSLYTNLINFSKNTGKGSAIRAGIEKASGDYVIFQDADLEYNPEEYQKLLEPFLRANADVVYGSRFRGGESMRILFFWHSIGNRFLTLLSNAFTNLVFTDMETCFKMFRRSILNRITLRENGFGVEPEITAKISHLTPRPVIFEVGISYQGRTYEEGKKIGWKDGIWAIICILRYNIFR